MLRRTISGLFLLTSLSVGLGALGHGSQWGKHVLPALGSVDAQLTKVLALVWYWVSGTMLVFGALLVWAWWRLRRGDRSLAGIPIVIGIFYLIEGLYGALGLGRFFLLFVVQALLLFALTWGLVRLSSTHHKAELSQALRPEGPPP
jgi:hypothetical protein